MTTEDDEGLARLLQHVKEQRGFDFTGYKRASLQRRVRRRMDLLGLDSHDAYLDHLLLHPEEFTELFNTVLINVTAFFRDPEAWEFLRTQELPRVLEAREGRIVRCWSAGCASGEEAYSLAIALAEAMGPEQFADRVKIYATDVDEEALSQARAGTYALRQIAGLPEGLREKYFEVAGNRVTVIKAIRRAVIFGRNDLVQDAPISHVDVLTCRNTLMYFTAETQGQILNRLHFALEPDGVMFLGKAELLLSHGAMFRPVELRRRFFRKVASEPRDRRPSSGWTALPAGPSGPTRDVALRQAALMSSPAAQIVLDLEGRLALANHRAVHLFGIGRGDLGRPFQDLELFYRPVELRTHLETARQDRRPVWIREVELSRPGAEGLSLDVQVVPLIDERGNDAGLTVIFNDVSPYRQLQRELVYTNRQLESAYEELQSTVEELETTNEELQSTVEELETTNEELQSTNEELETMNEELQSMNDELQVSNESLRERQDEVDRLNRFMSSVLGSLTTGVVVIDNEMRVLAWNARAEELWGLRAEEVVGEHLMSLDIGLPLDQLRQRARAQLLVDTTEADEVRLSAVNRRGRHVEVRVTLTRIHDHGKTLPAAMLLMDVVEEQEEEVEAL